MFRLVILFGSIVSFPLGPTSGKAEARGQPNGRLHGLEVGWFGGRNV